MALPAKLGIVAGGGILPRMLRAFCNDNAIETFIIGYHGYADPSVADRLMRLGEAGGMMAAFREQGCRDLVLIGSVARPKFSDIRPDLRTAAFYAKLGFRALGDDGFLKAIRSELEDEGFTLHGIHELMPDLLMPAGVLTKTAPDEAAYEHIHTGLMASRVIGKKDIGQCVVVSGNDIVGTEDNNGTNALIKRAGCKGAILVKSSKPQQDRKLDMPTIGVETVRLCASLGYRGIAAETGGVLVVDREGVVKAANEAQMFVVGV